MFSLFFRLYQYATKSRNASHIIYFEIGNQAHKFYSLILMMYNVRKLTCHLAAPESYLKPEIRKGSSLNIVSTGYTVFLIFRHFPLQKLSDLHDV